ncbi:MAG: hypothetical protein JWL79_3849 [Frankiales bacterium]|nr:hypothetical protein [Frankiales bacterium]
MESSSHGQTLVLKIATTCPRRQVKKAGSRQWVGPALTLGSGTYTLAAHMGMGVRSFLPSVLRTAVVFID